MVSLHLPSATGVVSGKGNAQLPGRPSTGQRACTWGARRPKTNPTAPRGAGASARALGREETPGWGHPQTTGRGLPGHMPLGRPAEGSVELMAGKCCWAEPHREPHYREPLRTPSAPPAQRLPRTNWVKQTRGWGDGLAGAVAPYPGLHQEPLSRLGCMSLQASAITGWRGGHGGGGHSSTGGGSGPSPPPKAGAEEPPAGPGAEDGPWTAARPGRTHHQGRGRAGPGGFLLETLHRCRHRSPAAAATLPHGPPVLCRPRRPGDSAPHNHAHSSGGGGAASDGGLQATGGGLPSPGANRPRGSQLSFSPRQTKMTMAVNAATREGRAMVRALLMRVTSSWRTTKGPRGRECGLVVSWADGSSRLTPDARLETAWSPR